MSNETTNQIFKNTAKQIDQDTEYPNAYTFDEVPALLFVWIGLFQAIVSLAGTRLLTKKFHDQRIGIYKCEGGCNIAGIGDLVLYSDRCRFDFSFGKRDENRAAKMAGLISKLVLEWDPMDPVESLVKSASKAIKVTPKEFHEAFKKLRIGPFSGDTLSSFFDHNPFCKFPIDRDYLRYCKVKIEKQTDEEVDQEYSDADLGNELLKKMVKKIREAMPGAYTLPLCCSPSRVKGKLSFLINTGRQTQIDGWKTEKEINDFLAGDGILIDTAK